MAVFMDPLNHPSPEAQRARYEKHENNINDPGYRKFTEPLVLAIEKAFDTKAIGLDFGSGTASAASTMLKEKGYDITLYDPFFAGNTSALDKKYDFIICCEVIEHFQDPAKEFTLLTSLINPRPGNGIYCMTDPLTPETDFKTWYYKNDITHVFFYTAETTEWIQKKYGFAENRPDGRLLLFLKK